MSSINATVVKATEYRAKLAGRQLSRGERRSRVVLLAILLCAGVLYFWRLGADPNNAFYTVAVRSMTESWKAFFYGSFNPGNSITIDKIPGYLWPQALSARVFGFHPWALTLPEVIEALVTVIVTYRLVRRWAGEVAGLLAAAFLVLTPALIGAARLNNEEAAYTMCLVLAASATQRAASNGRLRSLVLAGVWVGLAFQCKMVEAWAVLPALAAAYLLAAPPKALRRVVHVAIAGLVTVAVSIAWIVCVALVPAADRPYIDGTTNNNPFSMVFGYNFLTRFGFLHISASSVGSVPDMYGGNQGARGAGTAASAPVGQPALGSGAAGSSGAGSSGGYGSYGGRSGLTASHGSAAAGRGAGGGMMSHGGLVSMVERTVSSQVGWLYALALVSIVAVLWMRRREPRTDALRAGIVMWSVWLLIYGVAYGEGTIHTYYVVTLAPALAAVCGAGVVQLWRAYRAGGRAAWWLPLALALSDAWVIFIVAGYPTYRDWLIPVLVVLGIASLASLAAASLRPALGRRALLAGAVAGVLAAVVAPGAWASSVITASGGQAMSAMGNVGPAATGGGYAGFAGPGRAAGAAEPGGYGGFGGGGAAGGGYGGRSSASRSGFSGRLGGRGDDFGARGRDTQGGGAAGGFGATMQGGGSALTTQERDLLDYAETHDDGARFVLTVTSWSTASPYILNTGADVLPMGGFTGSAAFPTLAQFQQFVKLGQVRFVLLPAETGSGNTSGLGGFAAMFGGGARTGTTVSTIESWVRADCSSVPASSYGGSATGGVGGTGVGTLYECTRS